MKSFAWLFLTIWAICSLTGCAVIGGNAEKVAAAQNHPKMLRAVGFSKFGNADQITISQHWLLAQQAAKLAGFRSLADQLYKLPLNDQKTIGSQVMNDESYRVYVDTYLRQARVVDYRTVQDTLKASLELDLNQAFYTCLAGDIGVINSCLQSDNKLNLTRLGYKPAVKTTANLSCAAKNCSDQYYVQGFSKDPNLVDDTLLDLGMYDTEWNVHTGASLFGRLFIFQELLNGF